MNPWQQQLKHLKTFRAAHEDRWPGPSTRFPGRNPLGKWCAQQQGAYRKGELSRAQLRTLIEMGVPLSAEKSIWEKRREREFQRGKLWIQWNLRLGDLKVFHKRYGHWPRGGKRVSRTERGLSKWVYWQRVRFMAGRLEPERRLLLEKAGYVLQSTVSKEALWLRQYEHLKRFRKLYPNRWPVMSEEFPPGNRLGSWVNYTRNKYAKGVLSPRHEVLLKSIGFSSENVLERVWMKQYRYLKAYRKRHSQWPAQLDQFPRGNGLGGWVTHQRQKAMQGALPAHRRNLLDKIGFPFFDFREVHWMQRFEELKEFHRKFPGQWPKDKHLVKGKRKCNTLGNWCLVQRSLAKRGKLSEKRVQLFRKIGFPLNPPREAKWRNQFDNLLDFRRHHPNRWPAHREHFRRVSGKMSDWL